jgi:DNA repair exonuclease SbcCD ATPase subunit
MTTKGSTMRVLRQTLSQIERKRTALKEQQQRLRKEKIDADKYIGDLEDLEDEIDELKEKLQDIETQEYYQKNDINYREQKREYRRKLRELQYEYENTQIELEKISMNIADSREYMEGAIKEIASFQDAYEQIKSNKGVPDDWDEETFEDMEPDFHVRHIFYVGYQDLKGQGRINHSTVEHAIQFGMNPEQVEAEIIEFINQQKSQIFSLAHDDFKRPYYTISGEANYNEFEDWLETMTSKYRKYYQNAMKTLGLDTMNRDWYQFHDYQIEENKEDN